MIQEIVDDKILYLAIAKSECCIYDIQVSDENIRCVLTIKFKDAKHMIAREKCDTIQFDVNGTSVLFNDDERSQRLRLFLDVAKHHIGNDVRVIQIHVVGDTVMMFEPEVIDM